MPKSKAQEKLEKEKGMPLRDNTMVLSGDQLLKAQKGANIDLLKDTEDRDVYVKGEQADMHKMVNVDPRYAETRGFEDAIPGMFAAGIKPLGDKRFTDEQIKEFMAKQSAKRLANPSNIMESEEDAQQYLLNKMAEAKKLREAKAQQEDPRKFSKLMNLMKK